MDNNHLGTIRNNPQNYQNYRLQKQDFGIDNNYYFGIEDKNCRNPKVIFSLILLKMKKKNYDFCQFLTNVIGLVNSTFGEILH